MFCCFIFEAQIVADQKHAAPRLRACPCAGAQVFDQPKQCLHEFDLARKLLVLASSGGMAHAWSSIDENESGCCLGCR
jgi:hypothetical protein